MAKINLEKIKGQRRCIYCRQVVEIISPHEVTQRIVIKADPIFNPQAQYGLVAEGFTSIPLPELSSRCPSQDSPDGNHKTGSTIF